ncbi:MAG: VWA domain-containing protein [Polyangiaceae bacterium]
MELRSPWGLALAGLLVPLIALYILKVKRQRLAVPSTWLWSEAQRDLLARSPFKRLVAQLPLILQALALLLLALALASPATRGGAIAGDHVALVIDTSASMAAKSGDTTRMAEAREAAAQVVRSLGPGADAVVIEAGAEAKVASPLDRDKRRLEAAVDKLEVREVQGKLSDALALATDRLRSLKGDKRIVLITDAALADPQGLSSAALPLDVIKVGEPIDNTGITRVDVRLGVDPATKRDQVQAFAVVNHFGSSARDIFVTLRQRNVKEPLASRKLRLEPGESTPVVLTFEPTAGDRGTGLEFEISPGDALPVDDRAYGRVPGSRKLPVVLVPKTANPWVKRALQADPDVELLGSSPDSLASAEIPPDSLVVVDGACPTELPAGDLLVLNPPKGPCHRVIVGEDIEEPMITSWNEGDPRLRFLTLDGVSISKAHKLEVQGDRDSLVRSREGTLISDLPLPGRNGTLIAFDVGESNWPLKASFVLFIRNLVEQARAGRARGVTGATPTGSPLRLRVPPNVPEVSVVPPSGGEFKVQTKVGLAVVPEVARAGFYHASWTQGRPGSVLAVANLTSRAESDTRPRELPKLAGGGELKGAQRATEAFTTWTWLLALLALALLGFDAWWLTRKPKARAPATPHAPRRRDLDRPLTPQRGGSS